MDTIKATKTILEIVKNLGDIARMINPEINHITMYSIDGAADFTAYADKELEDRDAVLYGHLFDDGSFKIGDTYYKADGSFDFTIKREEKSA